MKILTLSCGEKVMLDDEDYEKIPKTGWYLVNAENRNSKTVYVQHDKYGRLHRYIMNVQDPNIIINHIDRNGLNNQKINLRKTTCSINKRNQSTMKNNKFNFNGISYEKTPNSKGRLRVRWSINEYEDYNKYKRKAKIQKSKSFALSKFSSIDEALKAAILFRIQKMKEFDYILDERSTTIERKLLENDYNSLEELLEINYSNIFE